MLPIIALLAFLISGCGFIMNDELNQAALAGDLAHCEYLLGKGVDVNATGMHAMKPIMSAAEGGDLETVMYLLSMGADVNAHNNSGSARMWAIEADEPRIVELLLMNGADPTWRNSLGRTAFDLAREKQAKAMIDLLQAALKKTSKAHKPIRKQREFMPPVNPAGSAKNNESAHEKAIFEPIRPRNRLTAPMAAGFRGC